MKYTQGKWLAAQEPHDNWDIWAVYEREECVADGLDAENARLIAAAPDMLEAIKNLRKEINAHIKLDVKKHYSLMVAENEAQKIINQIEGV